MFLTRRQLLKGATALASGSLVGAAGPSDLTLAQLEIGANWNPRPNGLRRLAWEIGQRTSIEAHTDPVSLAPSDESLFRYPFLYWAGSGAVAVPGEEDVRRLRRHLTFGGTILIDSADADPGGVFDISVRRTLGQLLPRQELVRIEPEHVIHKSFYLIDHQAGRVLRSPYLEGIEVDGRIAVIYCQNDLGGAWDRDAFGRWTFPVSGGDRQREMAFRLGINIVMYALCLDYKEDLVHTPFILKRRR